MAITFEEIQFREATKHLGRERLFPSHLIFSFPVYRLKIVEQNDYYSYRKVVFVSLNRSNTYVKVAPNPVSNQVLNLQLAELKPGRYLLTLISSGGQVAFSRILQYKSEMKFSLNLPKLAPGYYTLQLSLGKEFVSQTSVIVTEF